MRDLRLNEAVSGSSQVFKRIRQLTSSLLLRLEQAHVLDCDYGLVGERLNQLNVLIVERPHRLPAQQKNANGTSLTQKRHASECDNHRAAEFRLVYIPGWPNIWNLNGSAFQQHTPAD